MNDPEWKRTGIFSCITPQVVGTFMLWLPVAPVCNMRCAGCPRYCDSVSDLAVPGLSLFPDEAIEKAAAIAERKAPLPGVIIWGPGEPLANAPTFVALKKLSWLYPALAVTVVTNGLLLPDRIEELVRSGVRNIALSMNAVSVGTAERLYEWAIYRGRRYTGENAGRIVLQQQWNGLKNAVKAGVSVTVCTTEFSGVNDHETAEIKRRAEGIGAAKVVVNHFPE